MKALTKEEVPEEYHSYFIWDKQFIGPAPGGRSGLRIGRRCVNGCEFDSLVHVIRGDLKRGRRMRGDCKRCRNDGRTTSGEGYILINVPDHPKAYRGMYVPEHILVMEKSLGRYLDRENESVHHINGDKKDNRIENLQLRKRYHGKGQKWQCGDCGSNNILAIKLDG